jgi:hypothetical protein|tara:strand:- start:52 stop:291 length:240 start_codon:yes stop_codon:yes gene_type:complete
MNNNLIKQLDREIDSLRSNIGFQVSVRNQIIDWLEGEIEYNEPIISGAEVLTDGTHDIHVGRTECAEALLRQIAKFEEE